ncbi:MAG TPA: kelch repeat-containing protein [Chitinophagales bacterium]|nr:kelch repeat-containing protein [Chitinophagales bacterium]
MKKLILFFCFIAVFAGATAEAQGTWWGTNLTQAKAAMGVAAHGSKVYFAGGFAAPTSFGTNKVEIYDLLTQEWTMENLSVARGYLAGATNGDKIFFAGGMEELATPPITYSTVDIFNTQTNVWSVANLSVPRFAPAAASFGNKVLFAGGANAVLGVTYNTVDIYNTETEEWTTAALSEPRVAMGVAVAGGKAFFGGGFNLSTVTNKVDIYDFATGTWTTDVLSEARGFVAATAVGTKVFFAGGMKTDNTPSSRVDIYDTATGEWTTANLSVARAFIGSNAASACGKAFFGGGGSFNLLSPSWVEGTASNRVDIYNTLTNTWSTAQLSHHTIELGVVANGNNIFFASGSDMVNFYFFTVDVYTCEPPVGLDNANTPAPQFTLYPNPSQIGSSATRLQFTAAAAQAYTLQITNLQGQPVMPAQTLYAGNNAVYLPSLPTGMYFVTLTSGKQVQTLRWVVQ